MEYEAFDRYPENGSYRCHICHGGSAFGATAHTEMCPLNDDKKIKTQREPKQISLNLGENKVEKKDGFIEEMEAAFLRYKDEESLPDDERFYKAFMAGTLFYAKRVADS